MSLRGSRPVQVSFTATVSGGDRQERKTQGVTWRAKPVSLQVPFLAPGGAALPERQLQARALRRLKKNTRHPAGLIYQSNTGEPSSFSPTWEKWIILILACLTYR